MCEVFPDDLQTVYTGQVLPLKASGHRWNERSTRRGSPGITSRSASMSTFPASKELRALGLDVGDFVTAGTPMITDNGFVRSRHLDDKAGVAATLAALKALKENDVTLPVRAQLLVTCTEEIGHGAKPRTASRCRGDGVCRCRHRCAGQQSRRPP